MDTSSLSNSFIRSCAALCAPISFLVLALNVKVNGAFDGEVLWCLDLHTHIMYLIAFTRLQIHLPPKVFRESCY